MGINNQYNIEWRKVLAFSMMMLISLSGTFAQGDCATVQYRNRKDDEDAARVQKRALLEKQIQALISHQKASKQQSTIITIPVVVHVVYKSSVENVSDNQIYSQINVLNEDFRRTNADAINTPSDFIGVAADCEIEFCLTSFDPNGNPTTGITRTATTSPFFDFMLDDVKFQSSGGVNAWETTRFLNIWVCDLDDADRVRGYSTFPGDDPLLDGVVVDYESFGRNGTAQAPRHLGRTATHEVGHWLNLQHIGGNQWGGCGDDFVDDTPPQKGGELGGTGNGYGQNLGCPIHPLTHDDECDGTTAEMFMNYMDYTDDACLNMFTEGQKNRMRAAITASRPQFLTTTCCPEHITVEEPAGNIFLPDISFYQAAGTILSSEIVDGGQSRLYLAGDKITLSEGFHAHQQTILFSRIEQCDGANLSGNDALQRSSSDESLQSNEAAPINVSVFPNPSLSGMFTVEFDDLHDDVIWLSVLDVYGNVMQSIETNESSAIVDVSGAAKGIYFIRMTTGGRNHIVKLVFQ